MDANLLTLLTDFGLQDEYVGVVKGVVLSRAPRARLVDICHAIPPQEIRQAALMLAAAFGYFPAGSLHLVVVDPGVGTKRRLVLVAAGGHWFLAPDNGVLTLIVRDQPVEATYALTNQSLFLPGRGQTFHGRDILAPVAGSLLAGLAPAELGPSVDPADLVRLTMAEPRLNLQEKRITGEVVAIDHFGNLLTNVAAATVHRLCPDPAAVTVRIKEWRIQGLSSAYGFVAPGAPLATIGSRGFLEIAANQAPAAQLLAARVGDRLEVSCNR